MSSHDLSLNGINKTAPVKPDTKTAAVDKPESEGFIEELKEVMGLKEKTTPKKQRLMRKAMLKKAKRAKNRKSLNLLKRKKKQQKTK